MDETQDIIAIIWSKIAFQSRFSWKKVQLLLSQLNFILKFQSNSFSLSNRIQIHQKSIPNKTVSTQKLEKPPNKHFQIT